MKIEDFIKGCADGINDPTLIVMTPEEWQGLLNFQAGELFPEIGYKSTTEFTVPLTNEDYQIDLSGTLYDTLEDVKEVFLEDSTGSKFSYDNWIFDKKLKLLDLNPTSSKLPTISPGDYAKVIVVWQGYLPTVSNQTDTLIDLSPAKIVLLKKICIKEALRRILLDHVKLDRYRTLVGRTNEYALLSMIRDMTTEIELSKRRLIDTNNVRSF